MSVVTAPNDQVTFSHELIDELVSKSPGSEGSRPVTSLGQPADCIAKPFPALKQSYVVVGLDSAGSMRILAANCTDGTALAHDALAHISGL